MKVTPLWPVGSGAPLTGIGQTGVTFKDNAWQGKLPTNCLLRSLCSPGSPKNTFGRYQGLATRLDLPEGSELTHQGGRGYEFIVVLEGTVTCSSTASW